MFSKSALDDFLQVADLHLFLLFLRFYKKRV